MRPRTWTSFPSNSTYYRDQPPPDMIVDLTAGERIDVGKAEHDAFMAWAAVEVLHHTGVRVKELLEIIANLRDRIAEAKFPGGRRSEVDSATAVLAAQRLC